MLTFTTEYLTYNPLTSILTVRVTQVYQPDNQPLAVPQTVATWTIPVLLPVDGSGAVTTDISLIEGLVRDRIEQRLGPFTQQTNYAPPAGVEGAQVIYRLTTDVEAGQLRLIEGYILDNLGEPVEGAQVQSIASGLSGAVTTGADGFYSLPAQAGTEFIEVTQSSTRSGPALWPRQQSTGTLAGTTRLDITVRYEEGYGSSTLIADASTQANTVTNTGRLSLNAEVDIPAGAIVDSNGDPVDDVLVNIANNVVQDPGVASVFPGLFLGTPLVGSTGPIESYGFVEITITDPAGIEQLSLDPAVGATIYIPVDPDPVGVDSIPLWRLDDATGIWEQTGTATRVGSTNVFEASVTSFSFYNLDRPMFQPVTLTVTAYENKSFTYGNFNLGTNPAPGVTVTVDILDIVTYGVAWQGRGITDANGQLVLLVPAGFLSVQGKKGDSTYNGYSYQEGSGTASINLFNSAPVLQPPPPPPPPPPPDPDLVEIELIVAAGNDYSGETEFLIVEDVTSLLAAGFNFNIETGPAVVETGFDARVVDVVGNTLELSFPIDLTEYGFIQGATVTVVGYPD